MVIITTTQEARADIGTVWQILVDWRREGDFWGNIRDVRVLKTEGTTVEREATVGPRAFAQRTRQRLVLDPEKRTIKLSLEGDQIKGERTIQVVPTGDRQTRMEVTWDLTLNGLPGFVEGIVKNQIAKATENALKKIAEAAGAAEPPGGTSRGASR